jgi:hypothetical protein
METMVQIMGTPIGKNYCEPITMEIFLNYSEAEKYCKELNKTDLVAKYNGYIEVWAEIDTVL